MRCHCCKHSLELATKPACLVYLTPTPRGHDASELCRGYSDTGQLQGARDEIDVKHFS